MFDYITVGEITATFGVRGEVKVIPYTDFPERFEKTRKFFLNKDGLLREVWIERAAIREKDVILKIKGIDTPEEAAEYRRALLQIPPDEVWPLPPDSYYRFQIIGLTVTTADGVALGRVADILETGSNDVYVVRDNEKREYLIPALKDVIKDIDLEKGLMVIQPLPGLLEE
ncbi:16S rRNA-processing protein RimM [Thermacetogenium phaeum DSM 12270]|jgi:16S rRNA processing protein RimM|uniref:Ribosome maturation factor RimM n=1 Tax=Thermacetogenium phaeum (strain ATCC BAA-254 / DSM 26808 / PB) TaxID=1089553 RepID=K4LEG8_THEPS|nr:ribosome maturation factor RimM [Thermacetogenium phaeum]AFV11248.1 16S rRNA-processing protein RimM [Thermacetogenium phaeum DSM 12270]